MYCFRIIFVFSFSFYLFPSLLVDYLSIFSKFCHTFPSPPGRVVRAREGGGAPRSRASGVLSSLLLGGFLSVYELVSAGGVFPP